MKKNLFSSNKGILWQNKLKTTTLRHRSRLGSLHPTFPAPPPSEHTWGRPQEERGCRAARYGPARRKSPGSPWWMRRLRINTGGKAASLLSSLPSYYSCQRALFG